MERTIRSVIGLALVAVVALFVGRLLVSATSGSDIIGRFAEGEPRGGCPQTDNCRSSYAEPGSIHAIEPLACNASVIEAEAVFADAIGTLRDVETVSATSYIVYSRVFRFPDDVRIQVSSRGIEIISSSRLGAGDLGVNERRVERLREIVEADPRCI